jgi:hypothetical protein
LAVQPKIWQISKVDDWRNKNIKIMRFKPKNIINQSKKYFVNPSLSSNYDKIKILENQQTNIAQRLP